MESVEKVLSPFPPLPQTYRDNGGDEERRFALVLPEAIAEPNISESFLRTSIDTGKKPPMDSMFLKRFSIK